MLSMESNSYITNGVRSVIIALPLWIKGMGCSQNGKNGHDR